MTRTYRTLILWVFLIFVTVALYKVFATPQEPAAASTDRDSFWGSVLSQFLPITVLFVLFVAVTGWRRARNQGSDGVALLSQGRYAEALQSFEATRRKYPRQAAAAFNTGVAKLCLWKLEAAREDLKQAATLEGAQTPALATVLHEHLAMTLALLGDGAGARSALAAVPQAQADAARVALTEGVLLLRDGRPSEARQRFGSFAVRQLGGSTGALARAADAMCVELMSGERRHVDRIALYGETGPQELGKAWPELVAFVDRAPAV